MFHRALMGQTDTDLLGQLPAGVNLFQLIRINVLPGRQNDNFLAASAQEQVAETIQAPQVAGAEPAIEECLLRGFWIVVVAAHHIGTPHQHFPVIQSGIGLDNLYFHLRRGLSHRAEHRTATVIQADYRGGFAQTVGLDNPEPQAGQIAVEMFLQARPAAGGESQGGETGMDAAEESFSGPETPFDADPTEFQHGPERQAGCGRALLHRPNTRLWMPESTCGTTTMIVADSEVQAAAISGPLSERG